MGERKRVSRKTGGAWGRQTKIEQNRDRTSERATATAYFAIVQKKIDGDGNVKIYAKIRISKANM